MRRLLTIFLIFFAVSGFSRENDNEGNSNEGDFGGTIHFIKKIPSTPVRDQYKTSTCWSFSGISLLETELIRTHKGSFDLSEMYVVRYTYARKADRFVRMHGKANFAPGGETNDVTEVVDKFGIVPESVYTGLKPDETNHKHAEMDRILEKYVQSLVDNKELTPVWMDGFQHVLDSYLGTLPDFFEYEGSTYTPASFAEYLDIDPSDYVMITSFIHEPYYEPIILEIPDNWSWAESYNVPLDILEEIVDSALIKGYSVSWAADVTEEGFNFNKGFAVVPRMCYANESEAGVRKWRKLSDNEREETMFSLTKPVEELEITPEVRQKAFDNYSTTDDHGMHILGLATDKSGREFYYVKNSWGTDNPYNGYLFVSKPYFRYKTISVMLNKSAIPRLIGDKLSL